MTRPLPASILPPLAFLIRLLGSRKDAEALGAARAIGRQLAGVGLGFDDLAAHVERAGARQAETPQPSPAARPRPRRAESYTPPVYVALPCEEREALLSALAGALADPRLEGWPRRDLAALVDRLERGDLPPTRKMLDRAERAVAGLREGAS